MAQSRPYSPFRGFSGGSAHSRRHLLKLAAHSLTHGESLVSAGQDELLRRSTELRSRKQTDASDVTDDELSIGVALAARASVLTGGPAPFPVQVLAAVTAGRGHVVEMGTGEGKTLAIALAAAALALSGRSVHVVTANEYLAARDRALFEPIAVILGISVGLSRTGRTDAERVSSHRADVVYGTARSFGYDYLSDNMAQTPRARTSDEPFAVIVDEIDSVLLDDVAAPFQVSTPTGVRIDFSAVTGAVALLDSDDVFVDSARGSVALHPSGSRSLEVSLGVDDLYADRRLVQRVYAALSARFLYRNGTDYVLVGADSDRRILPIDRRTGRRVTARLNSGLHEALESKEGLPSPPPSVIRGRVSVQSLFMRYRLLGGMSGTAMACRDELDEHYARKVFQVPPNVASVRVDHPDRVYATATARASALSAEVAARRNRQQPVLVVTESVEVCERMGELLGQLGEVRVLSARNPEMEAEILSRAGEPGAVTVATLMAGRGVDIVLGGDREDPGYGSKREQVLAAGGLAVISTARFGLTRFDQQVRGRCGRQGDPGETLFLLSLEDDLPRTYAPEQIRALITQDEELPAALAARVFAAAQSRVEAETVAARRAVLELDKVLAEQREEFYRYRAQLLQMPAWPRAASVVRAVYDRAIPHGEFSAASVAPALVGLWPLTVELTVPQTASDRRELLDHLTFRVLADLRDRLALLEHVPVPERLEMLESVLGAVVLDSLDLAWAEHLNTASSLQDNARLASLFGQRADRLLASTLAASFARIPERFARTVMLNLAGLQVTSVSGPTAASMSR